MQTERSPAPELHGFHARQSEALHCRVCAHRCHLAPGQIGACGVRANQDGEMRLLTYGRVVAAALDPIEKKPLRHFRPGSQVYTIATPGCTLACCFCQNWEIALTARRMQLEAIPYRTPEAVVAEALALGADGVGFSYTEPVVSLEFTLDVMRCARASGLFTVWHTNGYMTPHSAAAAAEWLDAACIDLKTPQEAQYRRLTGGQLAPVLETIRAFKQAGIWVEISSPVLAGHTDSGDVVAQLARLILENLGANTPWHLLRGHPSWKMTNIPITSAEALARAERVGRAAGLRRVYAYY